MGQIAPVELERRLRTELRALIDLHVESVVAAVLADVARGAADDAPIDIVDNDEELTPRQQKQQARLALLEELGRTDGSFIELARESYVRWIDAAYLTAEAACNGVLLNAEGMRKGIVDKRLFTENLTYALRYASEELKDHWRGNQRWTFEEYRLHLLGQTQAAGVHHRSRQVL